MNDDTNDPIEKYAESCESDEFTFKWECSHGKEGSGMKVFDGFKEYICHNGQYLGINDYYDKVIELEKELAKCKYELARMNGKFLAIRDDLHKALDFEYVDVDRGIRVPMCDVIEKYWPEEGEDSEKT